MNETEIDLRGVIGLLRRQLRLIIGTVVVVIAVAAIVIFSLTPVYTASTLILVDPSRKNLLDPAAEMMGASSENARVESEVEILRSDAVLLQVIRANNLISDPEFGVRLGLMQSVLAFLRMDDGTVPAGNDALQAVIGNLRRAVSAQRRGLTYLLSIQASSRDRDKAALLANQVAEAYINAQVTAKVGSTLAVRDILQGRLADASAAVVASEEAFDALIDDNIARISASGGSQELLELRRRLEEANSSYAITARLIQVLDDDVAAQSWDAVASSLQSEAIAELERQREMLATRLAAAEQGTQLAVDLQAELAKVESGLATAAEAESAALRRQVAESRGLADELRRQLRSSVLVSDLPADVLTRIYELQQNAEIARRQYETLLARVSEVDQQSNLQIADARVVSPALAPSGPSFPNPRLFLTLAAFGALVLGVGLAFLYEHYIGGFTSDGQVASVLKLKVAASVPRQRAKGGADQAESVANQMIANPLSAYAEAVRRVRAEIDQALRRAPSPGAQGAETDGQPAGKVLMVSSAAPGEGKTTMALSLARAYAMSGRSVLLIDADLRKPSLHRHMGVEASTGLLEYLTEPKKGDGLAGIVFKEEESNLLTLIGARRSDVPTDQLIASKAFEDLVALARSHFEIVVLDTPPVGPVVDGLYLAKFADVIALVVRWASTSQQDARDAAHSLEAAKRPGVPVLVILNQQEGSGSSYRSKFAGYYSEAY
jgi:polysaccharide biosynthesis transport protein